MKKITFFFLLVYVLQSFAQDSNYRIRNLNSNKKFQDFGVSFINDTTVVFSSARYEVFMNRKWLGNKQPFLSLYSATLSKEGELKNIKPYREELESKFHDSNLAFSKNGKTVYFSRNNFLNSNKKGAKEKLNKIQIFKASINEKGEWGNIQKLPFVSEEYDFGHPTLNKDDSKLFFVSNKPGGYGKTDIYVTDILNDSTYSTPRNLGPKVNTSQREYFPFIDLKDVLYFASDGFVENFGGLDIYATKEKHEKTYYDPIHLEFPLNSNADDFGLVKIPNRNQGYFSSNRELGKGSDDIYIFDELNPIQFKCSNKYSGFIFDASEGQAIREATVSIYRGNEKVVQTLTDQNGYYMLTAECNESYTIVVDKDKYLKQAHTIDSFNSSSRIIKLEKEKVESNHFKEERGLFLLNTEPIFYDLGKSSVNEASISEIKKIAYYMKLYPEIIIQIRSHTDSRGSEIFNMNLSKQRANTIKDLLIEQGVLSTRIFATGFGEIDPINKCKEKILCTEEEHLQNRRTDFVILNPTSIKK